MPFNIWCGTCNVSLPQLLSFDSGRSIAPASGTNKAERPGAHWRRRAIQCSEEESRQLLLDPDLWFPMQMPPVLWVVRDPDRPKGMSMPWRLSASHMTSALPTVHADPRTPRTKSSRALARRTRIGTRRKKADTPYMTPKRLPPLTRPSTRLRTLKRRWTNKHGPRPRHRD